MISVDSFFTDTLNTVDAVVGNFVSIAYSSFVQANAGLISLLFTVYVIFLGMQFLSHTHHFSLGVVTRHLIVMLCVYAMVMNWQIYNLFVYNIFTNEPGNIAKILVTATDQTHTGSNIAEALNDIFSAFMNATAGFFGQASFSASGIAFICYAGLVFVIGLLMCVFALLLFVYAKMMMAVALALGPIFILFVLWEPTKAIFAAWLRKLITIALIPIITSAILMLMLSVIQVTLPMMAVPANEMQFYGIAPFLALSLATSMILSQVFGICSSLAGGITLASLSTGADMVSSAWQKMKGGHNFMRSANQRVRQIRGRSNGKK